MILASLNPDSLGAYHQQFVVHLDREMDGEIWLRAVQIFLQQHGGLMARFEMRDGDIFTARSPVLPTAEVVDLRAAAGSPNEQLQSFLEGDRAHSFEIFGEAPPWRSVLLSLGKNERAWLWS